MAKTLFEAIGYRLGLKAAQAKNVFDLMEGTKKESLRAEIRLGRDMAAALLLRQTSGRQAASAWLGQTGRQVLSRAFSRDNELEADAFVVALVGAAGGDALAGERLLEKLAQLTSGQSVSVAGYYFVTHPPLTERIANLMARRPG